MPATTTFDFGREPDQDLLSGLQMSDVGTWELDLSTKELTWSAVTRSLFGIVASDRVSYSLFLSLLDPRDKAFTEAAVQRSVDTGCRYDVEYRVIRQPGGSHWIRARGGIIVDATSGRATKFVGVMLDTDDQKLTEKSLRRSDIHLRSILDTVPDAIIVIDEAGIIQFFSSAAERMFGYSGTDAIGTNVSGLMPDPDRARHDSYLSRYAVTQERKIIGIGRIVTGRRRDGTFFPMNLSIGETPSGGKG